MPTPIKRYQNRKLYNTITKRYITLEDVGKLIRGGSDIVVTDSVSGEDITTHILTQVIMGQEKRGQGILSQGLLTGANQGSARYSGCSEAAAAQSS